jgi:hypothetical protein
MNGIRTCRIQEIHLNSPGHFRGVRFPYGRKKLVANPQDLSPGILEIAQLHLFGGSLVLYLRRGGVVEVFLEFSEACPETISWDPL